MQQTHRKRKLTTAEVARDKAIRARFAKRPNKSQLLASQEYAGPMSIEEYMTWCAGKGDAPLTKQLQAAIKSCGKTLYAVSQESGVSAPILQRFMSGERGITLDTAGKLAAYLGLGLWPDKGRG